MEKAHADYILHLQHIVVDLTDAMEELCNEAEKRAGVPKDLIKKCRGKIAEGRAS